MMLSASVCACCWLSMRQGDLQGQQLVIHFAEDHGRPGGLPLGGDDAVQLLQGMAFNLQRFIAHHLQLRVAAALLIFQAFRQHRQIFIGAVADDDDDRFLVEVASE